MQQKAVWVGVGSVAIVAVAAAVFLLTSKATLHGAVINPPFPAAEIQLQDTSGKDFALSSLRGKVVVLYFGYTNCPDECPLTMAHLKLATDKLGPDAANVEVAMITTDPKRDNAQDMRAFLDKFDSNFIGLVGTGEELAKVWKDYGVTVEDSGETHSFFVYVIDRAGNFRETFLPDSAPADIAADLKMLLQER
jgi:protein SCO1